MRVDGTCYVLFVYDLGHGVDLPAAEAILTDARRRGSFKHKRRLPDADPEAPPSLHLVQASPPLPLGDGFATGDSVEVVVYALGAVSVTYPVPVSGPVAELVSLSDALYDNQVLLEDSRRRAEAVLTAVREAISGPRLSSLVEDYVLFRLAAEGPLEGLWTEERDLLARILRAEPGPLSPQEVQDALGARLSYGPEDAVVVDWFAALLLGHGMEDERRVLELATVELLKLRALDADLDARLQRAHEALLHRPGLLKALALRTSETGTIARMQTDSALLFEGITNALKLLGDQYLARLHRAAGLRFHLAEWDQVIERKLATLDSIYGKLADRTTTLRMEALEWIIIVLIAVSIGVYFVPLH